MISKTINLEAFNSWLQIPAVLAIFNLRLGFQWNRIAKS